VPLDDYFDRPVENEALEPEIPAGAG